MDDREDRLTLALKWILMEAGKGIPDAKINKNPAMNLSISWWYNEEMFLFK